MSKYSEERSQSLIDVVQKPKSDKPEQADTKNPKQEPEPKQVKGSYIANPPHGDKSGFVKISITLPPEIYEQLRVETTKRKVEKISDPTISGVVREALVEYLTNKK